MALTLEEIKQFEDRLAKYWNPEDVRLIMASSGTSKARYAIWAENRLICVAQGCQMVDGECYRCGAKKEI